MDPRAELNALRNAPGRSHALRVAMLFALVVVLQIPALFVSGLVSERRGRRDQAITEIASKWGGEQTLVGPALVVPWQREWFEPREKGPMVRKSEWRRLVLLPDSLHAVGRVRTESRSRGIYRVPVYRFDVRLTGRFREPEFEKLGIDSAKVAWSRASLVIGVSDTRAIQEQSSIVWNGRAVPLEPGVGDFAEASRGVHADLELTQAPWNEPFELPLSLNGSAGAYLTPFGRETIVDLHGDWPSPSFQGLWLPTERAVSDTGFHARWSIPSLGRNFPQAWTDTRGDAAELQGTRFGVQFASSIDAYRLCDRTVKYVGLFFILTFTAFWMLELLGGRPLHPVQYGLIGAALVLFLMLELSLSEHIGFGPSYAIASLAVVALIVYYASAALGSMARALFVGLALGLLYAFHYVVLRNEDYALLLGTLLLFATLAAVMGVTRRLPWYGPPSGADGPGPRPQG